MEEFPKNIPPKSFEKQEDFETLAEEMATHGRLIAHTWLTEERARLTELKPEWQSLVDGWARAGAQDVIDGERRSRHLVRNALLQYGADPIKPLYGKKVSGVSDYVELSDKQRVNAALTIEKVIKTEVIMGEEKFLHKEHWYSPAREKTRKVRKGEREVSVAMSAINGERESQESAYRVVLVQRVPGLVGGRGGVTCTYQLLLPEGLARQTFELLSKQPSVIKDIVAKFDTVMAKQLEFVPNDPKRLLVIPEGQAEQAYELDTQKRPTKIREEFIKTIS